MLDRSPLSKRLAAALPSGVDLTCFHISTKPHLVAALFAPGPGQPEEATSCESHFLAISSPACPDNKEVLVFAVEVLIFTTPSLTFLFISKADSSGFTSRLNFPKGHPSIIATVTSTFVDFLLEPRLDRPRVVLSLFARAQNQYLFPGSVENAGKHVLDDRHLIKWWCRVLDRSLRAHHTRLGSTSNVTAHLVVPGCDKGETKAFFPSSSRLDLSTDPKWINSYPVDQLVADVSKPPRSLVPRLPDDPKARFLGDLDGGSCDDEGRWRSVKTLDEFWDMMSYRQECSAGRLVGFIWMVFRKDSAEHAVLGQGEHPEELTVTNPAAPQLITPANSQAPEQNSDTSLEPIHWNIIRSPDSPPPSSPAAPTRLDAPATQDAPTCELQQSSTLTPIRRSNSKPDTIQSTEGEIILDVDQYDDLMEFLLDLDFAGEALAAESSRSWINKASEISRTRPFGCRVCGESSLFGSSADISNISSSQPINVLTGIRKKRKASQLDANSTPAENGQQPPLTPVNTLASNLVRKKTKAPT